MEPEQDLLAADLIQQCDLLCDIEQRRGQKCRHDRTRFSAMRTRVKLWWRRERSQAAEALAAERRGRELADRIGADRARFLSRP